MRVDLVAMRSGLFFGALCLSACPKSAGTSSESAQTAPSGPTTRASPAATGHDAEAGAHHEPEFDTANTPTPEADQLGVSAYIAGLDALQPGPGAGKKAQALFLKAQVRNHGAPPISEAALRVDLEALLDCLERVSVAALDQRWELDPAGDTAMQAAHDFRTAFVERVDGTPPASRQTFPAPLLAQVDVFLADGATLFYDGEGEYSVTLDFSGIAKTIDAGLSPLARAYLQAEAWQQDKVDARFDEPGFVGEAEDIARAIGIWEKVAALDKDQVYSEATTRAHDMLKVYFEACMDAMGDEQCKLEGNLRASMQGFAKAYPGSAYVSAVTAFLAGAKKRGYKLSWKQHEGLVAKSLPAPPT